MDPDTDIGGVQHRFPQTNQSAIVRARKPVYKYVRLKWQSDNEDAKDLTQGFFANAFEKNHFANYDVSKAVIRSC